MKSPVWFKSMMFCIVMVSSSSDLLAQTSPAFVREGNALQTESQKLNRTRIDLLVRQEAIRNQQQALQQQYNDIQNMPAGVGRNAAITGYSRDLALFTDRRDTWIADQANYQSDKKSYDDRYRDYQRRMGAAAKANKYQPGDRVSVEWHKPGNSRQFWSATVLKAENGKYYVSYAGYGSEWNEWIGSDRIR
jgi:hypothetical protein